MTARRPAFPLIALLLAGCTAGSIDRPDTALEISRVRIDPPGRHAGAGPDTLPRCSGFVLSEAEVRRFLTHAARFRDDGAERYGRVLPCTAGGSAIINGRKYRWLIRAGGLGELVAGSERYLTVCGKGCCDKVPGIC